ncbi:MAG: T9SS type A sorting domain-containing protein, partial [Alloprevotella sp.]
NQGQPLKINYPYLNGKKIYLNGKLTSNYTVVSANEISMATTAGDKVFISLDGVSTPAPTGIASVPASDALNVSLNGRALSVTGKDVKSIRVYDAAGRTIQKTRRNTLNLSGAAAGTVLVEVTAADGTVTTQKHILK